MRSIAIITGYMAAVTLLLALCAQQAAYAGEAMATSSSESQAASRAANMGVNQGITFNSRSPDTATVYRAPSIGVPQSAFGFSGQNCGASKTGGSDAHGMKGCNTRADATILWKMGMYRVSKMRMVCFGLDNTRQAFEAVGGVCPTSATAESSYKHQTRGLTPNVNVYGSYSSAH